VETEAVGSARLYAQYRRLPYIPQGRQGQQGWGSFDRQVAKVAEKFQLQNYSSSDARNKQHLAKTEKRQ